ncbi:hypothetical protein COLINT_02730 [Collinsella intestinalis DSM 13280]|uniref:Uncharacterized protein n=1 Tax=Collinsella intestinalis DSM 13280 TaxID=521003 RepID=C4F9J5_9ACTN|nr:hypothetical protein COLINT_02730 [Collinsella intestinalis DSM 13280]
MDGPLARVDHIWRYRTPPAPRWMKKAGLGRKLEPRFRERRRVVPKSRSRRVRIPTRFVPGAPSRA